MLYFGAMLLLSVVILKISWDSRKAGNKEVEFKGVLMNIPIDFYLGWNVNVFEGYIPFPSVWLSYLFYGAVGIGLLYAVAIGLSIWAKRNSQSCPKNVV